MFTKFSDKRKAIAGEFFLNDSRMKHRSRKAFKKIQIWKASVEESVTDQVYQQQIENLVRYSFFQSVTSSFILLQQRYYDQSLEN